METGFVWKNIHSSEKGFKIISLPPITTYEKRVEKIVVPGRNGYLTNTDNSYEGEVKSVEFDYFGDNFRDIKTWLTGDGDVIFSNEPDRFYKANIINKVNLQQVLQKFHSGIIQFDCQPFGYSLTEKKVTVTTTNYKLIYNGTMEIKPVIKVYGVGDITLTVNNSNVILKGIDAYITLNGELEDAYKDTMLQNSKMQGEFPILKPGENIIDYIGNVSKIEIIYREAYL